ncbi:hypothetical protein D5086_000343 [Populus alba]|uniref:Uncharacterized protein n=1 Tax=Populus alba TaxID=43335 RepID=A0ACC4CVL0_POPAL
MAIFNEAGNLQCLSHLQLPVWISLVLRFPYLATLFGSRTRILLLLTVSAMDCRRLALCTGVLCSTSLNEFDLLLLSRWLLWAVWFKGMAEDCHLRRRVSSKLLRKIPVHHHISSSYVHDVN